MSVYRLPQLVRALIKVCGGRIHPLHNKLYEVTGIRINNHRLKALSEDDERNDDGQVAITGTELRALDKLIAQLRSEGRTDYGLRSLAEFPIFGQFGIMEAVERSRTPILFVLGTRPSKSNAKIVHDIRSWDCRAMGQVLHAMGGLRDLHVQFADCLPSQDRPSAERQRWFANARAQNSSIASIGSIHACAATEWLLSHMFGAEPFKKGRLETNLPFYFVWSPRVATNFRSSTSVGYEDIQDTEKIAAAKVRRNEAWGIKIGSKTHLVFDKKSKQDTFGVFAAQGQPNGQVFLAICGITGAATFAVANLLNAIKEELPFRLHDDPQPRVLWGAVRARVGTSPTAVEVPESEEVTDVKWLVPPRLWPE